MASELLSSVTGSGIAGIQRGVTALAGISTVIVTIAEVDLSKSFISFGGFRSNTTGNPDGTATLTSSTSLQLNRTGSSNTTNIAWEVIEFK